MPRFEDDPLAALGHEIDQKWPTPQFDAPASGSITQTIVYEGYPDPEEIPLVQITPKPYDGRPKHPKAESFTIGLALAGASVVLAKTIQYSINRAKR
jgi:hypothetical protein